MGTETRIIDLPASAALRLQSRAGSVRVIAEERDDVLAETDKIESFVDDDGMSLVVRSARGGSKPLVVRCPVDTDVVIGTQSGSVGLVGRFGDVRVTCISGSIQVDDVDDADVRSGSGSITLGSARGMCRATTVSGGITGGRADALQASTVSGSIRFDRIDGDIRARTISGSIQIAAGGAGDVVVKTVSGNIRIAVPADLRPRTRFKTMGRVTCDLPAGDDARIEAGSVSGSIEVVAAVPA